VHQIRRHSLLGFCLSIGFLAGCGEGNRSADTSGVADTSAAAATGATAQQCPTEAREKAVQLGAQMRRVSLLAPDTIYARALNDAYASLVTPELLARWKKDPAYAPGRQVSNPWPARIEIKSVESRGADCRVVGNVVYVSTSDTLSAVDRRPVTITVRNEQGWRISGYEQSASSAPTSGAPTSSVGEDAPGQIVRRYYQAIAAKNYDDAYVLWSNRGQASGQSSREFARGFAQTARVHVTVADSVTLEGAAGSQYATVPVVVDAVQKNGRSQHFAGTYTLRRSMVDGATAEQRQWRIESADLQLQAIGIGK